MARLRLKAIIPITLVLALIVGGAWAFNTFFLTTLLEDNLSELSEQKVTIERARFTLFPLGFTAQNTRFTDVEDRQATHVNIGDITAAVSLDALLTKKIHIPLIQVTDIIYSVTTASISSPAADNKETAPAKKQTKQEKKKKNAFSKLGSHFDAAELIQLPESTIEKDAEKIKQKIKDLEDKWTNKVEKDFQEKNQKKLEAKYNALSKKIDDVKSVEDAKILIEGLKSLSGDINQVAKHLKTLQSDFNQDMKSVREDYNALKAAGEKDLATANDVISIGSGDYGKISDIFFKDALNEWITRGQSIYSHIEKRLPEKKEKKEKKREKGKTIVFVTEKARPFFWIKTIQIYASDAAKTPIKGNITNISSEPALLPDPVVVNLSAKNIAQKTDILTLKATVDSRTKKSTISGNGIYNGYALKDIELAKEGRSYMGVNTVQVDSEYTFTVVSGDVNMKWDSLMHTPKYKVVNVKTGALSLPSVFWTGLKDVKQATVAARLYGKWDSPKVKIRSSLDKVFSGAVKKIMRTQQEQALNAARQKIKDELKTVEKDLGMSLDGLESGILSKFDGVDAKNKKLENGLNEKENGLKNFKSQVEDRVREELEKSAKKELKKLEKQFKNLF